LRRLLFVVAILIVAFISGIAGMYFCKNYSNSLEGVQASLSFGHLKRLRQIKLDLDKGCEQQAFDRLLHSIDEEKMLMAEYIQNNSDPELKSYIFKRDKELWGELKIYSIDWGKTWSISGCDEITR